MRGHLAHELGCDSSSTTFQQILKGTYVPPPSTDEYTMEYLKYLKKAPNIMNPPKSRIMIKHCKMDGEK